MSFRTNLLIAAGACMSLAFWASPRSVVAAETEPVRLIFDTDLGGDVDDVLALAMLHAFHERAECRLLAVTLSNPHELSGPLTDAVNRFYGHGTVPLGVAKSGGLVAASPYIETANLKDGAALRYPRAVQASAELPDAVAVLRQTLAAQPDGSVVVVQVGYSTNLGHLLESGPDAVSPLSGVELVKNKVRFLSIMAGAFRSIEGNDHFTEYNVTSDIPAAKTLAASWPAPIVWSGFEIGLPVAFPVESIENDFQYVPNHIVADAYRLHRQMPYSQPTWDLTSVLYGVRPDRGYFDLSEPGRVVVENDGFTRFTPDPNGRDRYLVLRDAAQTARVREALSLLVSEPPRAQAGK